MDDLISRSAVLEMIKLTKTAAISSQADFNKSQQNAIKAIADLFWNVTKDIPAVDAVPVVHGDGLKREWQEILSHFNAVYAAITKIHPKLKVITAGNAERAWTRRRTNEDSRGLRGVAGGDERAAQAGT